MGREYPQRPLVGVGAIVFKGKEVLLVRRGHPPAEGAWAFPGGLVELGESSAQAIRREVREECGISIEPVELAGLFEPIVIDEDGRVRYHYVVLDFLARYVGGDLKAASDVWEARWVSPDRIDRYPLSDDARRLLERARAMLRGELPDCCPSFREDLSRLK